MKSINKLLTYITLVIILIKTSLNLNAATVPDLYNAAVPIDNNAVANSRPVLEQGLLQVLIKLTGNSKINQQPAIKEALKTPDNYLLKYSQKLVDKLGYRDETNQIIKVKETLSMQSYSSKRVDSLLKKLHIPVFGKQRPLTLVWLVVDNDPQNKIILNESDPSALGNYFKETLNNQTNILGIPIAYPILDLEEQINVTPQVILTRDPAMLQNISARYSADMIVSAMLQKNSKGIWLSKWLLINGAGKNEFEATANSAKIALEQGVNWLSDNLAKVYTKDLVAPMELMNIRINGVSNVETYVAVDKYIAGLSVVDNYKLHQIGKDWLRMGLNVKNGRRALLDALNLDNKLVQSNSGKESVVYLDQDNKIKNQEQSTSEDVLQFRWRS